ncbi:hypothetical protein L198_00243 [Cryptococcus wingfieldii CBS 7118]|uniref:Uncharacterized protein n=1 Tax=Cryptococcus wingfieldii CBS 7118 TaxID=1295528 RepID=A0A1E3K6M3_9TREE|nr:hypothetical protein L198_00243 [Cryptococcus wingfieldii CBS 7118]ODO08513.1 hypothetical protein L198_00243 [Cryptococcus wingfieldii CBS 7118]
MPSERIVEELMDLRQENIAFFGVAEATTFVIPDFDYKYGFRGALPVNNETSSDEDTHSNAALMRSSSTRSIINTVGVT